MLFVIETDDNNIQYFDDIEDIPSDLYDKIIGLKCNDCNLDNIDFIGNFINIKKLNVGNNKIKTLPLISNLEELDIYCNELVEIPILPNLIKLYAFNNKLTELPNLPNLKIIDISHNNISQISLGEHIEKIYIGYNKINNINILNTNVLEIDCSNNELTNINFIHGLTKLNKLYYKNNPISYEPPYVKRFISNKSIKTNSIHPINDDVKKIILRMLDKKPNTKYERIETDILNSNILIPVVKQILFTCLNDKIMVEPVLRITFLELCLNLWTDIKKKNLFDNLNKILLSNKCRCISCIFNDIINIIK
jgi:Leucine-rich repeat (LRR) protein